MGIRLTYNNYRTLLVAAVIIIGALLALWHGGSRRASAPPFASRQATDSSRTASTAASAASAASVSSALPAASASSADSKPQLRPFDPNTADSTTLVSLGLTPWQARSITRYRQRGGRFSYPEDFAQLDVLTVGDYRRLEPYITIAEEYRPAYTVVARRQREHPQRDFNDEAVGQSSHAFRPRNKIRLGQTVNIATADTTELMTVPGIGSYFARRTVELRQRLGGFADLSQLYEIDNFPEEAMDYLTLDDADGSHRQLLDLNTLSAQQLARHPYITYAQARAIADYRRQHGPLTGLDDLRLSGLFTDEDIERLKPYVKFSELIDN